MTNDKKPSGPFRAEDFAGVDMSDRAGKTTRTRFGPTPHQAENIAAAANDRLAPLWDALEHWISIDGYENPIAEADATLNLRAAYRALRDREEE